MEKLFSLLGKAVLVLLIIGGLAYGGYRLGQNYGRPEILPQDKSEPQPEPTEPVEPPQAPDSPQTRLVEGGVPKSEGLVFDLYSLEVPLDWMVDRETGPGSDRVTISKGDYEIRIFQAATGGALCLFSGDPEFEGPSARYDFYTELTTADGRLLRRSGSNIAGPSGMTGFTFCQRTSEGDFIQPTTYGHLNYSLPQQYDNTILAEMDRLVTSLKAR